MHVQFRQLALVLVTFLIVLKGHSAEISAFNLTEVNGVLALRYLYDEQSVNNSGSVVQNDIRKSFQQELLIDTRSYVYHPYLLNMDISGSLLLDQSEFDTLDAESSTTEELINLSAKFNFLEKKPYPVTLYYHQQNPSVSAGVEGHFIQENIRYGIDASLMQPVSPVLVALKAFHQETKGEGFDQIVNDQEEQVNLRLYTAYSSGAHMELVHQENQLTTASGSPGRTITAQDINRSQTNFDSRNMFGRNNQIQLRTNISHSEQDQFPVREESTFTPIVSWKHNENMDSYYRFYFSDLKEALIKTDLKQMKTGVAYHTDTYNAEVSLQGEDNMTTDLETTFLGTRFNYSYKKPLTSGELQFNFSSLYENRDQKTDVELADVYGERVVLNSIDQVTLSREYIIIDSIVEENQIVVSNENRTQRYQEGIDYRLILIAEQTEIIGGVPETVAYQTKIQRLVGGSILDGQTVLIDYSYKTGGSFAYDRVANNLSLNWSILSSYNIYFRYLDSDINLVEGAPTIQLNSMTGYTYGARADKPLLNGIVVGGEVFQETRKEEVNPYDKQSFDAFVEMPLPNLTNIRLTARYVKQDNENSEEDTDLRGLTLKIQSRPWLRGSLTWESTYENDVGGSEDRLVQQHRMRLTWSIRQLSVGAMINYNLEQQADIEYERWEARVNAGRRF